MRKLLIAVLGAAFSLNACLAASFDYDPDGSEQWGLSFVESVAEQAEKREESDARRQAEEKEQLEKLTPEERRIAEDVERGLSSAEKAFLQSYRILWRNKNMDAKLAEAIDSSVTERLRDIGFGKQTYQILFSDELKQQVLESVAFRMSEPLDEFMAQLEQICTKEFHELLIMTYRTTIASNLTFNQSPFQRSYIRQSAVETLHDNGISLLRDVSAVLDKKYPAAKLTGGKVVGHGTIAIGTGLLLGRAATTAGRRGLVKYVGIPGIKLLGSKAGQLALKGVSGLGWLLLAKDIFDAGTAIFNAEDDFRREIKTTLKTHFTETIPHEYWLSLRPMVKDGFDEASRNVARDRAAATVIQDNPTVKKLLEGLNENETQEFSARLASLARVNDIPATNEAFLNDFGKVILETRTANFARLTKILRGDRIAAKQWFDLAGTYEYMDLYAILPEWTWEKFAPGEESLKILQWVSKRIPSYAREKALRLNNADLNWIRVSMPERFLPDLFSERYTAGEVQNELTRLKKIPNYEERKPWMGDFDYLLAVGRSWFIIAGVVLVAFGVIYMFLVLRKKAKEGNRPAATQTQPSVIITVPQQQPYYSGMPNAPYPAQEQQPRLPNQQPAPEGERSLPPANDEHRA